MVKLENLDIKELDKKILGLLGQPKRLAVIAAKLNIGYTSAWQKIAILQAKGHIIKIKTMRGKTLYTLCDVEL